MRSTKDFVKTYLSGRYRARLTSSHGTGNIAFQDAMDAF